MYTVKIIDGKPWVVEKVPRKPEISDFRGTACPDVEYNTSYMIWLKKVEISAKYPTIPEHLSHWQALEGKELQLGRDFQVEDHGHKCENGNGWAATYSLCATATPIPQPNEDEVYRNVVKDVEYWACDEADKKTFDDIVADLKESYTISKK